MKHLTFLLEDKEAYEKARKKAAKKRYRSVLLQLYTSLLDSKKLKKILKKIQTDFPGAVIVGATTAGEISHAKIYKNNTVISLSLFRHTKVESLYTPTTDSIHAKKIANSLFRCDTKAAIVLSEGLYGEDYEGFIHGLHDARPDVLIAGGLAADTFKLKQSYVFEGTSLHAKGSVIIAFSGKKLYADNRYNLNWYAVGKEFTITKANGKTIEEIDGQNAYTLFKQYLGEDIFDKKHLSLPDFQLLYKEGSTVISRTPMKSSHKAIRFAAPIKEGQKVRFGFSNAASVISGANDISAKVAQNPAQAIYIFSCIARKILLGDVLENEFRTFEAIAPTAGFFTYGEFYSTGESNALLNCTTTMLILSEKKQKKKPTTLPITLQNKTKDNLTFKALTHFIQQTSSELDSNIKLLEQYKEIVDEAFIVVKTDTQGHITYINDNFCKLSGCQTQKMVGKIYPLLSPHHNHPLSDGILQTLEKGKIWRGEVIEISLDGSTHYLDTIIMPIVDETLQIHEYIAVARDMTQEVLSQKKLKESKRFIRAVFDNQDSILISTSKSHKTKMINQKFFEYFDFQDFEDYRSKHKCIGELFLKEEGYIHPDTHPNWLEMLANSDKTDYKVKMHTRNGTRTFSIKVHIVQEEYIINLHDITTLEEAVQKANQSEKAKSRFLANMSHEIRTPLNGILGFIELLEEEQDDAKRKEYIEIIKKSGTLLLHIVNDILDFSKIESGEIRLQQQSARLKEELTSIALNFVSLAHAKQLQYHIRIDERIPNNLVCDIQRLKQIVANLLGNAIKFTPEHGEVLFEVNLISSNNTHAELFFRIKDSGIGIPKEKQELIFQPFAQADDSIDKRYGGTGLGLSICNQYLSLMGSKLELVSQEGVGSDFFFTLSLPISKPSKPKLPERKTNRIPRGTHKVLIAEDNDTNRMLISIMLEKKGIAFDTAKNGKEALLKAKKNDYDLLFMDINMPVLDGLQAIKRLRKEGYEKPIVTLSANVIQSDIETFKKAGANDTLHKPIASDKLEEILKRYLSDKNPANTLMKRLSQHFSFLDEEAILQLLASFDESASAMLQNLQEKPLDYKTAHTIKGLAANFLFSELAAIALKAEEAAKEENKELLKQLRLELEEKLQQVRNEVRNVLNKSA